MFDHKHYVPILKAKQSERLALRELDSGLKKFITPLFEIQKMTRGDIVKINNLLSQIKKAWPKEYPFFLDVDANFLRSKPNTAVDVFENILEDFYQDEYGIIPVTGLNRSQAYQDAIQVAISRDENGLCIRLDSNDWADTSELSKSLNDTLSGFGLKSSAVDIILDFKDFMPNQAGTITNAAVTTINSLPKLQNWRTLTIAGTTFPPRVDGFPHKTPSPTPRSEWDVWSKVVKNKIIQRKPTFGDYTIVHPEFPDIDFRMVTIDPKIKYATDDTWLILRWARSQGDREKFYDLCDILVTHPEYCGSGFSWGDRQIHLCSKRSSNYGSPYIWVKIGINHHLTLVANQVSSFP